MASTRRVWAGLRATHPDVDPADPTDDWAQAVIAAAGADPDVWETGGQSEALGAYRAALAKVMPDHTWATDLLKADPITAVELRLCNTLGIPHEEFLDWPDDSADLAIASLLAERDTCQHGHPREAMNDVSRVEIKRVYCAVCARVHDLEKQFRDKPEDYTVGWHTEVTPR
jgi:hypothetical protein